MAGGTAAAAVGLGEASREQPVKQLELANDFELALAQERSFGIRKCFWLRWQEPRGRERRLRSLGLPGPMLNVAQSYRGAWHLAATGSMHVALSNAELKPHVFLMPSDLAGG